MASMHVAGFRQGMSYSFPRLTFLWRTPRHPFLIFRRISVILVFEKAPPNILRANLYANHAAMRLDNPYAYLWKANVPGAVEEMTAEAQRITDEAEGPAVRPENKLKYEGRQ